MAERRKDSRGRNLRDGEDQMPDGRYRYRYIDKAGKRQAVYSWRLVPTDKVPAGKRDSLCLREKVEAIERDKRDGIDGRRAAQITLNDMFDLYMAGKRYIFNCVINAISNGIHLQRNGITSVRIVHFYFPLNVHFYFIIYII